MKTEKLIQIFLLLVLIEIDISSSLAVEEIKQFSESSTYFPVNSSLNSMNIKPVDIEMIQGEKIELTDKNAIIETTSMKIETDSPSNANASAEQSNRYDGNPAEIFIVGASLEKAWGTSMFFWRIRFPDVETWSAQRKQNFLGAFPEFKKDDPSEGFVYDIRTSTRFPPIKFVQKLLNWMSNGQTSTVTSTAAGSQNFNFLHYVWTLAVENGKRNEIHLSPPPQP